MNADDIWEKDGRIVEGHLYSHKGIDPNDCDVGLVVQILTFLEVISLYMNFKYVTQRFITLYMTQNNNYIYYATKMLYNCIHFVIVSKWNIVEHDIKA